MLRDAIAEAGGHVEEFGVLDARKLERPRFFEHGRLFRRVPWVRQIFHLYAFDSPWWNERGRPRQLSNEYLGDAD